VQGMSVQKESSHLTPVRLGAVGPGGVSNIFGKSSTHLKSNKDGSNGVQWHDRGTERGHTQLQRFLCSGFNFVTLLFNFKRKKKYPVVFTMFYVRWAISKENKTHYSVLPTLNDRSFGKV